VWRACSQIVAHTRAAERAASAQGVLELEAPRALADLVSRWWRAETFRSPGTRAFYRNKCDAISARFGARAVADFAGAGAGEAARALVRDCHALGWSSHQTKHVRDTLARALAWGASASADRWYAKRDLLDKWPRPTRDGEGRFYVPCTRALTEAELWTAYESPRFLGQLRAWAAAGNQAAVDQVARRRLAFIAIWYFCLRPADVERVLWGQVDPRRAIYLLQHKKTSRSRAAEPRRMPPALAERLAVEHARQGAPGGNAAVFGAWPGIRNNLRAYCEVTRVEHFSPNDMRRGCVTALLDGGVPLREAIAHLGHSSERMVREVYGRALLLPDETRVVDAFRGPAAVVVPDVQGQARVISIARKLPAKP